MLEEILDYLHNYFVQEIYTGEFTISDGNISLPFLQTGQYFIIKGSVFNDGLHQLTTDLIDETFNGQVWALAIPQAVIQISREAKEWNDQYLAKVNSPYSSESFGGYSYTKATSGNTGDTVTWQSVFGKRLNRWRKIGG